MNKTVINREVAFAYDILKETGIAKNGKINKTWRGQISIFGAAVTMGSLMPAIAFFSDKAGASVERPYLLDAILCILKKEGLASASCPTLFEHVKVHGDSCKEDIINAAIAIKLAMNLYILE